MTMTDAIDIAAIDEADHYTVLQVRQDADQSVIRAAYKALAQAIHPDKSSAPAAIQLMARINVAYAVLSDPEKRAEYDRQCKENFEEAQDDESSPSDEAAEAWDWMMDDSESTELLYNALFAVVELKEPPPAWDKHTKFRPTPLPSAVKRSAIWFNVLRVVLLFILVPATVLFAFASLLVGIGIAVITCVLSVWKPYLKKERQQRLQTFRKSLDCYERLAGEWKQKVSGGATRDIRTKATQALNQYKTLLSELRTKCQEVAEDVYEEQLFQHLEGFSIEDAVINGLGDRRKQTLASYEIYAAAHVTKTALFSVEGFGPALVTSLLRWKDDCIKQFEVDLEKSEEIVSMHHEAIALDGRIQRVLQLAAERINHLQAEVNPQRELLLPGIQEATVACTQAYVDMRLVQPFWKRWISAS